MPSKSPYAPVFKTTVTRGTPCWTAVTQIATKTGVSPTTVFKSLYKAGQVMRQKFYGQWIYWPTFGHKSSTTHIKTAHTNLWQAFVDWCVCSGYCTPRQFTTHIGSQTAFTKFFGKFWQRQFPGGTIGFASWPTTSRFSSPFGTFGRTTKSKPRRKTRRTRRTTTSTRSRWSTPRARRGKTTRTRAWAPSYKISRYRKTGTRRYRRAA